MSGNGWDPLNSKRSRSGNDTGNPTQVIRQIARSADMQQVFLKNRLEQKRVYFPDDPRACYPFEFDPVCLIISNLRKPPDAIEMQPRTVFVAIFRVGQNCRISPMALRPIRAFHASYRPHFFIPTFDFKPIHHRLFIIDAAKILGRPSPTRNTDPKPITIVLRILFEERDRQ